MFIRPDKHNGAIYMRPFKKLRRELLKRSTKADSLFSGGSSVAALVAVSVELVVESSVEEFVVEKLIVEESTVDKFTVGQSAIEQFVVKQSTVERSPSLHRKKAMGPFARNSRTRRISESRKIGLEIVRLKAN